MDRSIFDSGGITSDRLREAVGALTDREWAQHCLDAGLGEIRAGRVSFWVPRLTLLAALRLDCAAEFLPQYEHFLGLLDGARKADWHTRFSEAGLAGDLLHQSGRLTQTEQEFESEFRRVLRALGPPEHGTVADVGCGGGLWAIRLAKLGYRVIGTERHDFLVAAARRNAADAGVGGAVEFRIDDICASELPAGFCPRALCICVTPTLPDDAAFDALLGHLDRITRNGAAGKARCVLLGSNRWGPSRMTAVGEILEAALAAPERLSSSLAGAEGRLRLLEVCWWLQPRHLEAARSRFPSVERIGETHDIGAGTRVDFVLR